MFNIVLVQPEIPPNTGNVIRLCANTNAQLHLVEPLGFPIDHARMRRAGLDYHEFAPMKVHSSWQALLATESPQRMFALSTQGRTAPSATTLAPGDWFVFGCETSGLPEPILASFPQERRLRLPMAPGNRSINLSNAVAVVVYEAWRQNGFAGGS
ncbi:MAG: tRNA (uridine(34)/cytosine(34)/5-carboxymethylaminomethyluridine(34)-2'-O)-methyltransferase TrmL [Burkholderiaceae bacterium]|nr:tRNA (uridine(34)/cytosine(34)/5-carboxymethylaminomethyluridine(34)-2'-O)-methyltransferase TrmL [Burkholderiaceae bacterium]